MASINVLTINEEPEEKRDLVKIVDNAKSYFPSETWDDIYYIGKLILDHDVKITLSEDCLGAFLFEKLIGRIKRIRDADDLMNVLLAVTPDPIVAQYHSFDGKNFVRTVYLVHDYVAENAGVVSFFKINDRSSSKVVAHGLGHNKGLRHHAVPIDLMHSELLRLPVLQVEGFCRVCLRKLAQD